MSTNNLTVDQVLQINDRVERASNEDDDDFFTELFSKDKEFDLLIRITNWLVKHDPNCDIEDSAANFMAGFYVGLEAAENGTKRV